MAKRLLILFALFSLSNAASDKDVSDQKKQGRGSRNYDNAFSDFASDYNPEVPEQPIYSDAHRPSKIHEDAKPHPLSEKDNKYDQYLTSYPAFYKEYPYYWKGSDQPNPAHPKVNPKQMIEMMSMMKELQNTKQGSEPGFFSKLISDPKSILAVAIIPVFIMLASFIPLLVNYFMTGASLPSVLSVIASNKTGRNFENIDYLEAILEGIDKYGGRAIESGGCIEKAFCVFVADSSDGENTDYLHRIAKFVVTAVEPDWFGESRVANILSGIKLKDCTNICKTMP